MPPLRLLASYSGQSTRPSLFVIEPATGILLSNQTIRVMITTRQQHSLIGPLDKLP